jgi:hypothetical protein
VVLNFTKTHAASQLPITVALRQEACQETLNVTVVLPPLRVPRVGFVTLIPEQKPSLARASVKSVTRKRVTSLLITSINGSFEGLLKIISFGLEGGGKKLKQMVVYCLCL